MTTVLTAWVAVAGYTRMSLGQAHAPVAMAQSKPAVVASAVKNAQHVIAKEMSRKASKRFATRGAPRS